jgi:hypothetical protein
MPVLEYHGDLWGYSVLMDGDTKALCYDHYVKAKENGRIEKVLRALGTEDMDEEDRGKNFVYICDANGCIYDTTL